MKKWIGKLLVIGVLIAAYGIYQYNKGPRNLSSEKSDMSIAAEDLLGEFLEDETVANKKYLDKVMEVEGEISDITEGEVNTIMLETGDLMSSIACEMANGMNMDGVEVGNKIKVKGQCTGFLSDVVLVKCVIVN